MGFEQALGSSLDEVVCCDTEPFFSTYLRYPKTEACNPRTVRAGNGRSGHEAVFGQGRGALLEYSEQRADPLRPETSRRTTCTFNVMVN